MNNQIIITNQNEIKITNINTLLGFDTNKFLISASPSNITVLGDNLAMDNLNTTSHEIEIKGEIKKIIFGEDTKKKSEPFIKKLFK